MSAFGVARFISLAFTAGMSGVRPAGLENDGAKSRGLRLLAADHPSASQRACRALPCASDSLETHKAPDELPRDERSRLMAFREKEIAFLGLCLSVGHDRNVGQCSYQYQVTASFWSQEMYGPCLS